MGANQSGRVDKTFYGDEVNFDHFQILRAIGKGSFGKTRDKSPTDISCLPPVHFSNVDNSSMLSADWEINFSPHRPALFDSTQVSAITPKSRNNLVITTITTLLAAC
ncbi:hypothetical protein RN001_011832 [Aquatica leii]|uniref:Protein kinase domain-containing protein n=1 Tax=Aquatica leii TaxID=1421715 RepID=A0AAN7NXU5_9COLE|nr:hypothetical protein RN001_011832 [Aquatica leii]